MSVEVVPFEPSHLVGARVHPKQARHRALLDGAIPRAGTWSAFDAGRLVAVGGVGEVAGGVGGWVLFMDGIGPGAFLAVDRAVRRVLARLSADGWPVVAHVDPDYPEACRWADLLGLRAAGRETIGGRCMERVRA